MYGISVKGEFWVLSIDSLASSARSATLLGSTERSSPEARQGAPQARGLTASVRAERSWSVPRWRVWSSSCGSGKAFAELNGKLAHG